ncbi:hypothetical protein ACQKWADRAFT_314486 [Trichoderma austrokoningii]
MQFKPLLFLAAALPFTQAQAALTAKDVVDAIHNLTNVSAGALDIVKNISSNNILESTTKIADDLRQIVADITQDVAVFQGTAPAPTFAQEDQSDICEALSGFTKTNEEFFTALASKKNFIDATTLTQPIGSLMGTLRTGLNSLAAGVIALVPTCGAKARDELNDLDKTLGEAISAFAAHALITPGAQPPAATNHPIPAPLPGVVGSSVSRPVGGAVISATGPAVTPIAAPIGGQ